MADASDILREVYGHGYEPATASGDPNSLGYAMQGPAVPFSTADDMRVMALQKAEKDREPLDAASRVIATLLGGAGAVSTRGARPIPSPGTDNPGDKIARYVEAMKLHQRDEAKRGNPSGYLEGLGAFGGSTAAATTAALTGHPDLAALAASGMFMTRPGSVFMGGHTEHTGKIYQYLRALQAREAAKQPSPDNSGFALYADPRANASGAAIGEMAQQRPQYSLSPNRRAGQRSRDGDFPAFLHHIYKGEEKIGSASGHIDGATAFLSWLGASGQANKLGPHGISQLREAFRDLYPEVKTFEGVRSSGSRHGPAATADFSDKQSVTLPAIAAPLSSPDDLLRAYYGTPEQKD